MHELEGPNCRICNLNPKKFTKPLEAWESKNPGAMESLRLVSLELEATSDGLKAKKYDDLYFSNGGSKRFPLLTPDVAALVHKLKAGIGRDRIGPAGFEICTAPANGVKFSNQCDSWEEAFKADHITVNSGHGMHVHTDARDFCATDLLKLMMAYRSIQPALFRMVPEHRRKPYSEGGPCGRIRYTPELVKALRSLDGPKMIQKFLADVVLLGGGVNPFTNDRHVGCNIALSFAAHRTVEWRLPPGTILAYEMKGWARMFAKIMDWVVDLPETEAERLVKKGWNGGSSTEHLKEILDSDACSDFIALKQKAEKKLGTRRNP